MKEKKIKPCPFCGHAEVRCVGGEGFYWNAICSFCGCTGPREDNRLDAVRYWNTRWKRGPSK